MDRDKGLERIRDTHKFKKESSCLAQINLKTKSGISPEISDTHNFKGHFCFTDSLMKTLGMFFSASSDTALMLEVEKFLCRLKISNRTNCIK